LKAAQGVTVPNLKASLLFETKIKFSDLNHAREVVSRLFFCGLAAREQQHVLELDMQISVTDIVRKMIASASVAALAVLLLIAGPGAAKAQTVPVAVVSSSQTILTLTASYTGHIAVNSIGDAFYIDPGTQDLYELTPGSTTPIIIMTGLTGSTGARNVSVDRSNNLFVPLTYSGEVIEVPISGGTYPTNIAAGSISASSNACTAAPTTPCAQFGNGGSAAGYYFQSTDIGFDAAGDAFVSAQYLGGGICDGTGGVHCNGILKFAAPFTPSTAATLVGGGPGKLPNDASAQITADPEGDVFYADGMNVYEIAAGTTGAVVVGTGLTSPGGVSADSFGNIYVTDTGNNRIVEFPALAGVPQISKQFTLSYTYSGNGVGIDPYGRLYYSGYNNTLGDANLNILSLYNASFGSSAVGTAATAVTLSVVFNSTVAATGVTLSKTSASGFTLAATQPTGVCAAGPYTSGSNCSVTINYTPTAVGLQSGALLVSTATGNAVVGYVSGIGLGAAQTTDPGTVNAIGSGWKAPAGIAVDSVGNVYVSDATANTVSQFAPGSSTAVSVGTGLKGPTGVAVDGAGNVYIGDSGNARVVEVPLQNGVLANASQAVVYTGTSGATGLAVDSTGSLLLADSGHSKVFRLTNTDGTPNTNYMATLGTGFMAPIAVAVDNAGDTFIADQTASTVTEIVALTKVQNNVGSGYSHPSGVAADASGSIYVADPGNQRLIKIPLENGGFNANDAYSVGATVVAPYGVALDPSFNVYAVDNANASVVQIVRTQGTLALGRANLNTPTSQLNGEIGDAGNQSLVFKNPDYTATGSTTQFTVTSPSSGGCVNSGTVLKGFACTLAASFDPTVVGPATETLAFSDNAANTATPQLILTGTGLNLAKTTTVLTASNSTPALGQPVTVTATISSTVAGTPTGTVQFYLNSALYQTVNVTNGQAAVTFNNLNGGAQQVSATYSGDNNYAPSAATPITITVSKGTSTTTLAITSSYTNPQSGTPGSQQTLTATVKGSGAQPPTGTVSFYSGTTLLGSAPTASGVATLATSSIPTGNDTITAVYNGDVNYTMSTSAGVPLIISAATFTITPATSTLTLSSGQTGTIQYAVTSIAGYSGLIGLTCTGLPANSSCSFNPNNVALNPYSTAIGANPEPLPITALIVTGQTPTIPQPPISAELQLPGMSGRMPISLALLALAPLGLLFRRRSSRRFRKAVNLALMLVLLGAAATAFSGCGSNLVGITPKGQYNVTVTAYGTVGTTGPTTSQTATISLTIQ
jgi:hypothetical protein